MSTPPASRRCPSGSCIGAHMWTDGGGARGVDPDKAQRDLKIMQQSVIDEPDNWRYWFYLAQGYEVAGDIDSALETYEKRISMGGASEDRLVFPLSHGASLCAQKEWHKAIVRYPGCVCHSIPAARSRCSGSRRAISIASRMR